MRVVLAVILSLLLPSLAAAQVPDPLAPSNDAYLWSLSLPASGGEMIVVDSTSSATTQPDLFNPGPDGQPLGGGPLEPTACNGSAFGRTVWYHISPRAELSLRARATGFPMAVALYEWDRGKTSRIRRLVGCSRRVASRRVVFDLDRGKHYKVQVGGIDGIGGAFELAYYAYWDRDGDGVSDAADRCWTRRGALRHHGCPR